MEVHKLNVRSLEQTCFKVLKEHLCPENCIGLWKFTNVWNIPILLKLQFEAFHFICDNFEEVSLCEEFLQLAVQELCDILEDLSVTEEKTVYQSVLRWINHVLEDRQGDITTLLPKVRLGLMDKRYVTDNVLNNDVVKRNPESHLLVFKTLQVMSQPSLLCSEPGVDNTMFCRRLPNAVLLMIGFFSESLEAFDYNTNTWLTVQSHPSQQDPLTYLFFYSTIFLGGHVYIVGGGLDWSGPFNRVWRFNLATHTWQEMSSMQESRDFMSVTKLNGYIYAMGGFRDNDSSLRTAERYQPDTDQWTFIASMNEERRNASCSSLNNKIYICGGWNNDMVLKSAEYYNPNTNQWTLISPMRTPRFELGVVAYMGNIFAVGGSDGSSNLRSAEAYDPVTNTWHKVPEMVHKHCDFGIAVMNKRILVVSCWTKKRIVECYDSNTNVWSVLFSEIDKNYYDIVSCCVVSGLDDIAEYCAPREPIIYEQCWTSSKVAKLVTQF